MTERRSIARKNTPREKPQGVFSVQYYLVVAHVAVAAGTAPVVAAAGTAPVVVAPVAAGTAPVAPVAARVTLVDASVYLKPTELVDVALDVLAGLAPCLNLGVGELGHKDLLDTISANNCRK